MFLSPQPLSVAMMAWSLATLWGCHPIDDLPVTGADASVAEVGNEIEACPSDGCAPAGHDATTCPESPPGYREGSPLPVAQQAPDGDCYWIDATEVTRDQYMRFLTQAPERGRDVCSWKQDFTLSECEAAEEAMGREIDRSGDQPIVCVDWCGAAEYCRWAGGRLCQGRFGGQAAVDPNHSEWYNACSAAGRNEFPYGDRYDRLVCNGSDRPGTGCDAVGGSCQPTAAGDLTSCVTPSGVFDLSGNAAEWTDECDASTGEHDTCNLRGGSYGDSSALLQCDDFTTRSRRSYADAFTGIRCCVR